MDAAPTRPDDACDPAERIARQSRALQALADAGLELARALVDEVVAGREGRFSGVDPALAYSRIARAIRLSIALEARLDEGGAESAEAARSVSAARADDAGEAEAEPAAETEAAERNERHESERPESERLREAADDALLARPNGEVYAQICRDLGASPESGLFPGVANNDDDPEDASEDDADHSAPAAAAPARRRSTGSGRASLLRSAAALPLAGPLAASAPALGRVPRPPP